jgi:putative oxidoreductase
MKKLLAFSFVPIKADLALLILRLGLGMSLFIHHGIEKIFGFSSMQSHFPDPLHIGAMPGLIVATLSDGICSILVLIGLATRPAALIVSINMLAVFGLMHQFSFGDGHAELVFVYLVGFLTVFFAGPGSYSLDHRALKLF